VDGLLGVVALSRTFRRWLVMGQAMVMAGAVLAAAPWPAMVAVAVVFCGKARNFYAIIL